MNWLSIDPANKTGIALWKNGVLINTGIMRAIGKSGAFACFNERYASRHAAHVDGALGYIDAIVVEEGCGKFAAAVKSQGEMRGYWKCACDALDIAMHVVNVSEWRRVIKEAYCVSWPATTERKKALSIGLVDEEFGINVTDDEADAVLIGVAAMRIGLIPHRLEKKAVDTPTA